jgi:Tol biopolymer transport system component
MRRILTLLFIASVLLTACGAPATTSPAVPTQPAVAAPGDTPATASSPMPASGATPAVMSSPKGTIAPTLPPASAVIGLDNFSQLVQLHDYSADQMALVPKGSASAAAQSFYAISPDGKLIAASILTPDTNEIVVLNTLTGDLVTSIQLDPNIEVHDLAFTPDGQKLAYSDYPNDELVIWDIATHKVERTYWKKAGVPAWHLAISPDGKQIMAIVASQGASGTLLVWDAGSGKQIWQAPAYQYQLSFLQLSADGRRLFVQTTEKELTVYDATTWKKVSTILTPGPYGADIAAVSPDGTYLVTGNNDHGDILVWDAGTGQQVQQVHTPFASLADFKFSPDGSLLIVTGGLPSSAPVDDSLYANTVVFDTAAWKQVGTLPLGLNKSFQFAPDGKSLLELLLSNGSFALIGLPDEKILAARQVAVDFMAAVSKGDYAASAPLFHLSADDIKALQSKGLPTDPAVLLQAVCTQGAFPCLPATVIYSASQAGDVNNRKTPPFYTFLVRYTKPDGSLYRNSDGYSTIIVYVVQDADGKYRVELGLDLVSVLKK